MTKCMQVIGFSQTDFREQGFQVLAERVRMDGRAVVFCENVFWEWDTMLIAESHFAIAEPAQQAEHFFVHRNRPGSSIFGFALLHTLRHFFVSTLLHEGVDKNTVADLAGHGDTSFLERTYCHPQMQLKQDAAKRMSNSLFAIPNPELLVS